ncbi:hypothetical protein J6590_004675, partial [Homalodisca vitripennis]
MWEQLRPQNRTLWHSYTRGERSEVTLPLRPRIQEHISDHHKLEPASVQWPVRRPAVLTWPQWRLGAAISGQISLFSIQPSRHGAPARLLHFRSHCWGNLFVGTLWCIWKFHIKIFSSVQAIHLSQN